MGCFTGRMISKPHTWMHHNDRDLKIQIHCPVSFDHWNSWKSAPLQEGYCGWRRSPHANDLQIVCSQILKLDKFHVRFSGVTWCNQVKKHLLFLWHEYNNIENICPPSTNQRCALQLGSHEWLIKRAGPPATEASMANPWGNDMIYRQFWIEDWDTISPKYSATNWFFSSFVAARRPKPFAEPVQKTSVKSSRWPAAAVVNGRLLQDGKLQLLGPHSINIKAFKQLPTSQELVQLHLPKPLDSGAMGSRWLPLLLQSRW